jgi:periplasmic protein TonB
MGVELQMRIIYIRAHAMAVQILNDMPDAEVHRGEPVRDLLRERQPPGETLRLSGRALFMAATVALHVIAASLFMSLRTEARTKVEPEPIMATMLDAPRVEEEVQRVSAPPLESVVYALPTPPELNFENEVVAPQVTSSAITPSAPAAPPMVETVEYVRAPAPVYPSESNRKRERGTVLLRVLVDSRGLPAQIQVERSSGYSRLDSAAREAVEKAVFRPYEVGGIAQPAQVLIPIEFTRRAS